KIDSNGHSTLQPVPILKYPALISTLVFDSPGILLDKEPSSRVLSGGVAIGMLPTFGQQLAPYLACGTVTFSPHRRPANSQMLGRLLAKIAGSLQILVRMFHLVPLSRAKRRQLEGCCGLGTYQSESAAFSYLELVPP